MAETVSLKSFLRTGHFGNIRVGTPLMILVIVMSMIDVAGAYQRSNKSTKVRELINAAAAGETSKVLQILNSGVTVNATFPRDDSELSGMTALIAAASRGHSDLVGVLLKRGATVDLKHYSGETALMFAAQGGDKSTIEALLRAGADINATVVSFHAGELTPLSITINTDHPQRFEIARMLLEAKAEVNPKGRFIISPLMHAIEDLEMVQLLVAHGADVNQKNFRGATPLMGAAGGRNVAVVKYLIEKGADVKARDRDGYTALTYAENTHATFYAAERDEIIQVLKRAEAGGKP
jgi:ankyrin repeat protein